MRLFGFFFIAAFLACTGSQKPVKQTEEHPLASSRSMPHPEWVAQRVANGENRLRQSEAGKLVMRSIASHGGLKTWYSNGPLYFRFNYRPLGPGNKIRDSYQTVDTWSSLSRHQIAENPKIEFGWDGERAWKYPADAKLAINPRFWSLTPYYFVGLPFVLADEGVTFTKMDNILYQDEDHYVVKAAFGENVGDASDYYILYLNAGTFRLSAIRYVVSYKGFYPDGGHGAEKLMTYEKKRAINGIVFAQKHRTYKWSDEGQGEHITDIDVTDIAFRPATLAGYFEVPEGSYVMKGYLE